MASATLLSVLAFMALIISVVGAPVEITTSAITAATGLGSGPHYPPTRFFIEPKWRNTTSDPSLHHELPPKATQKGDGTWFTYADTGFSGLGDEQASHPEFQMPGHELDARDAVHPIFQCAGLNGSFPLGQADIETQSHNFCQNYKSIKLGKDGYIQSPWIPIAGGVVRFSVENENSNDVAFGVWCGLSFKHITKRCVGIAPGTSIGGGVIITDGRHHGHHDGHHANTYFLIQTAPSPQFGERDGLEIAALDEVATPTVSKRDSDPILQCAPTSTSLSVSIDETNITAAVSQFCDIKDTTLPPAGALQSHWITVKGGAVRFVIENEDSNSLHIGQQFCGSALMMIVSQCVGIVPGTAVGGSVALSSWNGVSMKSYFFYETATSWQAAADPVRKRDGLDIAATDIVPRATATSDAHGVTQDFGCWPTATSHSVPIGLGAVETASDTFCKDHNGKILALNDDIQSSWITVQGGGVWFMVQNQATKTLRLNETFCRWALHLIANTCSGYEPGTSGGGSVDLSKGEDMHTLFFVGTATPAQLVFFHKVFGKRDVSLTSGIVTASSVQEARIALDDRTEIPVLTEMLKEPRHPLGTLDLSASPEPPAQTSKNLRRAVDARQVECTGLPALSCKSTYKKCYPGDMYVLLFTLHSDSADMSS